MQVFVQGPLLCIDVVMPDGRSKFARETLEQIQARYPGAEIADLDTWTAAKEKALSTEPTEITYEQYMDALEVLPPQRWHITKACESFELCEQTSGRITAIYVRVGKRFFTYQGIVGQELEDHVKRCQAKLLESAEPAHDDAPKCTKCGQSFADAGDGYDGLCGNCADRESKRIG